MQTKSFFIFLLFLLIVIAGAFYLKQRPIIINAPDKNTVNTENTAQTLLLQNEIATSASYIIPAGEISRGNPNKKQVIFTFDCGAGTNSADKILETAQKHNLQLTFFMTGKFAEKHPDLVKKFAAAGHEIFNHTYSHPHLTQITDEEIKQELSKTDEIISNLTGITTKPFFRAPYGDRSQKVFDIAKEAGFHSVYWTIDALDWMPDKTAEQVKQQIYSKISPGAIILMHIGDDITGQILDEVFTKLEKQEYKIVSLKEGLK